MRAAIRFDSLGHANARHFRNTLAGFILFYPALQMLFQPFNFTIQIDECATTAPEN